MIEKVQIKDATLYCGDCQEILAGLCSVDAVVTDPPYAIPTQVAQGRTITRNVGDLSIVETKRDTGLDLHVYIQREDKPMRLVFGVLLRGVLSAVTAEQAFGGTFHINETFSQLDTAYMRAAHGAVPDPLPCEIYCHSLTDPTILSEKLRDAGAHIAVLAAQVRTGNDDLIHPARVHLPDQYMEVSGVPDGIYLLQTEADPDGLLVESDRSNNCGAVYIQLSNLSASTRRARILGPARACAGTAR